MPPVTNDMLNARRDEGCFGITSDRKYYAFENDGTFVKRSLRPSEWQHSCFTGKLIIPRFGNERILNEASALRFIAANTNIPVPKVYACFQDDGAVYLVTEYIKGVSMGSLTREQRKIVEKELEGFLNTLRSLKSDVWGGPSGLVVPPYRVMVKSPRSVWNMKRRDSQDLVFCHNDFATHNVIVDPSTLRVNALIDWEYAGYFPPEFEGMFFRRPGPSAALEGEEDDVERLLVVLEGNRE